MNTKETDLAWLAGFIDGEGCFHFRRNSGTRNYYYPVVRVANTDVPTLDVVLGILDRTGLAHQKPTWRYPDNGNLPSWDVAVAGSKKITQWLTALIPYLHTKRGQAEDMLRFLQLRAADTSQRDYSDEEYEIMRRISKRMVILPRQELRERPTHCANGPLFTDESTYLWNGRKGFRACRICRNAAAARARERRLHPADG